MHSFVIVAEGAHLEARTIADHLDDQGIGFESRITTLGHVQRGGSPSAFASTNSAPTGRCPACGQRGEGSCSSGASSVPLPPSRAISTTRFQAKAARTTSRSPIGTARIGSAAGRCARSEMRSGAREAARCDGSAVLRSEGGRK